MHISHSERLTYPCPINGYAISFCKTCHLLHILHSLRLVFSTLLKHTAKPNGDCNIINIITSCADQYGSSSTKVWYCFYVCNASEGYTDGSIIIITFKT